MDTGLVHRAVCLLNLFTPLLSLVLCAYPRRVGQAELTWVNLTSSFTKPNSLALYVCVCTQSIVVTSLFSVVVFLLRCYQPNVIPRVIPIPRYSNESATSSGRGLVLVTTPIELHWYDVITVPRTLRYVVAVRYEVSAIFYSEGVYM